MLTFEPHPRTWFRPEQPPFRLTPLRSKVRQLEALGIDLLYVLPFDEAMAGRTAEAFVEEILIAGLQIARIVVGYDFVFGKGRGGSVSTLQDYSTAGRFGLTVVPAVDDESGGSYSSTRIRQALRDGDPATAAALLGRSWEIEGHVLPGDRRGRTIGFPTANLDISDYLRPRYGVYAVLIALDEPDGGAPVWLPAVANLGKRPHDRRRQAPARSQHLRLRPGYLRPARQGAFRGLCQAGTEIRWTGRLESADREGCGGGAPNYRRPPGGALDTPGAFTVPVSYRARPARFHPGNTR